MTSAAAEAISSDVSNELNAKQPNQQTVQANQSVQGELRASKNQLVNFEFVDKEQLDQEVQRQVEQFTDQVILDIFHKYGISVDKDDPILVQHYLNKVALMEFVAANYQTLNKIADITVAHNEALNSDMDAKAILGQIKQDIHTSFQKISEFIDKDVCRAIDELLSKFTPIIQGNELENVRYLFTVNNALEKLTGLTNNFDNSALNLKKISNVIIGATAVNIMAITLFWFWLFFN